MTPGRRGGRGDGPAVTTIEILDAASQAIAVLGVRRFRVEDVAEIAGVSRHTVINHLGKKNDIVLAMIDHQAEQTALRTADHLRGDDDLHRALRNASTEQLRLLRALPVFSPPLVTDFMSMLVEQGAAVLDRQVGRAAAMMVEVLGVDEDRARRAAEVLVRLGHSFIVIRTDDEVETSASLVADAVYAILTGPPDA